MSDTAAQSSQPTSTTAAKRPVPIVVWLVILLIAGGALAAAVMWSGGVSETLKLIGLGSLVGSSSQPPSSTPGNKPAGAPVSGVATGSVTATVGAAATGPALPAPARAAMYRQQLQSQTNIGKLVNNKIASLTMGTPTESASRATVPVRVKFRNGSTESGVMTLKKYNDLWYFFSLTAAGEGSVDYPGAFDSSVVKVITAQQSTEGNQTMITDGILGGGYKTARVTSVSKGSGTATVKVSLDGGSEPASQGEFVCISKADGPSTYWFIARFAEK
jgi:hypothetical protein